MVIYVSKLFERHIDNNIIIPEWKVTVQMVSFYLF